MENNNLNSDSGFSEFPPVHEEQPVKHSGLGITSFVIGLAAVLLLVIGVIISAVSISGISGNEATLDRILELRDSDVTDVEIGNELLESEEFRGAIYSVIVAGVMMFGAVGLSVLGVIFGIIGVVSKNRRKVFGVIGLVLNGIIAVGSIGLIVVGLIGAFSVPV